VRRQQISVSELRSVGLIWFQCTVFPGFPVKLRMTNFMVLPSMLFIAEGWRRGGLSRCVSTAGYRGDRTPRLLIITIGKASFAATHCLSSRAGARPAPTRFFVLALNSLLSYSLTPNALTPHSPSTLPHALASSRLTPCALTYPPNLNCYLSHIQT